MNASTQPAGPWIWIVPLIALTMMILRNSRARRLRVEMMWIVPAILIVMAGAMLLSQDVPKPLVLGLELAALGAGAALGWWRGRLTHISVDPETHALTSKASPVGMLLILAIFALRYGLRSFGSGAATMLHVSTLEITDILMMLAVGIVCVQRLEMALRATRLVSEARAVAH